MKTRWWTLLLVSVAAVAWLGGRRSSLSPESESALQQAAVPSASARPAAAGSNGPSRKRWAERIGSADDSGLPDLMREIPAKDRGAVVEAWLGSSGNSLLGDPEVQRLRKLLNAWVAEDPEAALEWADALRDPALRELGMIGVAGALAAIDRQRAFECLVSHGTFKSTISDPRITSLMRELSQDSLRLGPAALAELWKRLPGGADTVSETYGIGLKYPPGTDFRALIDELSTVPGASSKPIFLTGVSAAWMGQDPEGATAFLLEKIEAQEPTASRSWREIYRVKIDEVGAAAAEQWAREVIKDIPAGDPRGKFLLESSFLRPEGRIEALAQSSESAAWIGEALQFDADHGGRGIKEILDPLPEARRIEYLKTLRGPRASEATTSAMAGWNFTESQQEEIRKAISGS